QRYSEALLRPRSPVRIRPPEQMNQALKQLEVFVGEWAIESTVNGKPVSRARTKFEWLPGKQFLKQHTDSEPVDFEQPKDWIDNSPFPITSLFGYDDLSQTYYQMY